jgi:hypothetical protein
LGYLVRHLGFPAGYFVSFISHQICFTDGDLVLCFLNCFNGLVFYRSPIISRFGGFSISIHYRWYTLERSVHTAQYVIIILRKNVGGYLSVFIRMLEHI